jgi:hypothetical protein
MIDIRKEIFKGYEDTEEGKLSVVKVEIDIDSAEDLPAVDELSGRKLYMGSIAWDISTGDFYALNSEGTWYKQDGSGAYTPETPDEEPAESNASLLSSPLTLGKGVENEPDITEGTTSEPDILEEPVEKTTTRKKTSETETKDDGDAV